MLNFAQKAELRALATLINKIERGVNLSDAEMQGFRAKARRYHELTAPARILDLLDEISLLDGTGNSAGAESAPE